MKFVRRKGPLELAMDKAVGKKDTSTTQGVPKSQQIFKCATCHKFFRLPEREGDVCGGCHAQKGVEQEPPDDAS